MLAPTSEESDVEVRPTATLSCSASVAAHRTVTMRSRCPRTRARVFLQVRRVDQDMINEFGRLNTRKNEVREELELEAVRATSGGPAVSHLRLCNTMHVGSPVPRTPNLCAQKRKQDLEDAEESVMLAESDAGTIKCVLGAHRIACLSLHANEYDVLLRRVLIGEAFIDVDAEYAQAFIEKKAEVGHQAQRPCPPAGVIIECPVPDHARSLATHTPPPAHAGEQGRSRGAAGGAWRDRGTAGRPEEAVVRALRQVYQPGGIRAGVLLRG